MDPTLAQAHPCRTDIWAGGASSPLSLIVAAPLIYSIAIEGISLCIAPRDEAVPMLRCEIGDDAHGKGNRDDQVPD